MPTKCRLVTLALLTGYTFGSDVQLSTTVFAVHRIQVVSREPTIRAFVTDLVGPENGLDEPDK